MHTGDLFARKGLPFVDVNNTNGSAIEFGATLTKAVAGLDNIDTVIPGHNDDPLTWQDFTDYTGFYNDVLSKARAGKADGKSVEEVVEAYVLPDTYSDFQAPANRLRTIVQHIFDGR